MKYDTSNECAFPAYMPEEMGIREGYFSGGMSLRHFAAIQLRVPDSGDEHIDAMIHQANRHDFAGQALAAMQLENGGHFCSSDWTNNIPQARAKRVANMCRIYADALIEELNR